MRQRVAQYSTAMEAIAAPAEPLELDNEDIPYVACVLMYQSVNCRVYKQLLMSASWDLWFFVVLVVFLPAMLKARDYCCTLVSSISFRTTASRREWSMHSKLWSMMGLVYYE